MARFMLSTLHALLAGDVSAQDACYTISAHLASVEAPCGCVTPNDSQIQPHIKRLVQSVAVGTLSAEDATQRLVALKQHLVNGGTLNEFSFQVS
ncbi:hypothetical protein [Asticcacaulis taihuensis]|uniref:hypothetical protein n=1 Tax=Asticcacaulis taihuensis TaxID=260084 RepID=UPI0026E9B849|nr:hypothetical protein [Asticcacaulis taihuensis]